MTADPGRVSHPLAVAVFASGGGSNLQALLDHHRATAAVGEALWRPVLVVADRPGIGALDRARDAGIPSQVVPVAGRDPEEVATELLSTLGAAGVQAVVLAGYLRLIPARVVRAFRGRILNIHPSLLPAFGGKGMYGSRIHEAVLDQGVRVTGVTVHLVDEEYDRGRILAQWPLPVLPGDDPLRLAGRVLEAEHRLYPRTVDHLARALAEGRAPGPLTWDPPAGSPDAFPFATVPPNPAGSMTTPRRALLSVSDKTGIEDFARSLVDRGFQLLSTGGTARRLRDAGLPVTSVSEITGHPEIMEGRVKTLHPAIHGPLLARREVSGDLEALAAHGYHLIDVVAVNLYPFRETVARGDVTTPEAMEQVDIGGPTMLRAAAKNHAHVHVVVDPADYPRVLDALEGGSADAPSFRRELAAKVFHHVAGYDAAVAAFLDHDEALPPVLTRSWSRVEALRYGENPDQAAAFYAPAGVEATGIAALRQHHGKALSYNNLLDLDGALLSLAPFALSPRPAVCIVKHTTPCGLAVGESVADAYRNALRTDPVSAFGSVIAVNREVDAQAAELMGDLFVECLVAPGFSPEALEILTRKKNVRILTLPDGEVAPGAIPLRRKALAAFEEGQGIGEDARRAARFLASHGRTPEAMVLRGIHGGLLAQSPPIPPFFGVQDPDWRVVTERQPEPEEQVDLAFAWAAVYGVKSNAILLAADGATLGIGAGQMSRVDSSRLAVQKAREAGLELEGCALASDAFFPFRDGVDAAAEAGVRAIIQPGGSVRDEEVVQAADEHGLTMIFTGRRLFRH